MKGIVYLFIIIILLTFIMCSSPINKTDFSKTQEELIQTVVDSVSNTEVIARLHEIEMERDPSDMENIILCETRMIENFINWGYSDIQKQTVSDSYEMNNIIVTKAGLDPDLPPILITAHWDTIGGLGGSGNGMDDNASGVAGVLEIARISSTYTMKHTIIFILFAFEEDGFLGSKYFVERIDFIPDSVFNFDLIAYTGNRQFDLEIEDFFLNMPDTGDFIAVLAIENSQNLGFDFCNGIKYFVPDLKYYFAILPPNVEMGPLIKEAVRSDHISFWKKNMKALFITDTADLRNPYYHTESDTFAKLDIPFMIKVIKATAATVLIRSDIIP